MARRIVIATRESRLALWQAEYVRDALHGHHPGIEVELLGMTSRGDQLLDIPLAKVGGKGLFVKELETALLDGSADIAVHSMKDVPMEFPTGLELGVICERGDPTDAFVSNEYRSLTELPAGSVVGTSSLRRECQIRARRPDLEVHFLRGNVQTRLRKLDEGQFDAIILASAGLRRLGLDERIAACMTVEESLPAGGQGAVGIELRTGDTELMNLLQPLHHRDSAVRVEAERAMTRTLQGSCEVPIGCYAELMDSEHLWLRALVGSPDGSRMLRAENQATVDRADALGVAVAEELLRQGAGEILAQAGGH